MTSIYTLYVTVPIGEDSLSICKHGKSNFNLMRPDDMTKAAITGLELILAGLGIGYRLSSIHVEVSQIGTNSPATATNVEEQLIRNRRDGNPKIPNLPNDARLYRMFREAGMSEDDSYTAAMNVIMTLDHGNSEFFLAIGDELEAIHDFDTQLLEDHCSNSDSELTYRIDGTAQEYLDGGAQIAL